MEARRAELRAKGWRVPPHLYPPEIYPGAEQWYFDFFELCNDRSLGMTALGPIPAASIDRHTAGWPPDDADAFRYVIRQMDIAYRQSLNPEEAIPQSGNAARDAFRAKMR